MGRLSLRFMVLFIGFHLPAQAGSAHAADTFSVDAVHSTVLFRVKHMQTSYAYGRFNDIAGTFTTEDNGSPKDLASLEVTVKAASIDTGNAKRDQHLRGVDFFNAAEFPEIKFKTKKAEARVAAMLPPGGIGVFDVTGDLTLHGVTKEVTFLLTGTGSGKDMAGKAIVGLEGSFAIKRSEFGMKTMVGPVADDVYLTVSIEGVRR